MWQRNFVSFYRLYVRRPSGAKWWNLAFLQHSLLLKIVMNGDPYIYDPGTGLLNKALVAIMPFGWSTLEVITLGFGAAVAISAMLTMERLE